MRTLPILLLVLCTSYARGQIHYKRENWHGGIGLTEASLNFHQNGAGGVAIPFRYDLVKIGKSSISLGSNIKIGSEDEYGVSFPAILAVSMAPAIIVMGNPVTSSICSQNSHYCYIIISAWAHPKTQEIPM